MSPNKNPQLNGGGMYVFNTDAAAHNGVRGHGRNLCAHNDDNGHCYNYVFVLDGAALSNLLL